MNGRRRGRFPSKEELELWAKVTRHDEPLERRRLRAAVHDAATKAARETPAPIQAPERPAERLPAPAAVNGKKPSLDSRCDPPLAQPFDPHTAKRLARGRHSIDARLDLHGMRQADAHAALRHFIARCQAEGHRHVLIITGKGTSVERHTAGDFWTSEERGVLRRLVPHWLSEPSIRMHVVSYTESHSRHGGSGALYVTIRKTPRDTGR
jgi:DNA-nicking Smr family endonuclease